MRIFLVFKYDGSYFNGFQRQKNVRSVQKDIEESLSNIYNKEIEIKGAGRTDAKVHANGQTATADVPYYIDDLKDMLNMELKNIIIKKIKVVDDDFHARFSAKGKVYLYKIKLNTKGTNPYYLCLKNVDVDKMKETSKLFIGTHNFINFVSGSREDYTSTIHSIKFFKCFNYLLIYFDGVGFYRYMVRNLVGAMIDVGKGKTSISVVKKMIEDPTYRKQLSTALPQGLYLQKVKY